MGNKTKKELKLIIAEKDAAIEKLKKELESEKKWYGRCA